jgi:uncharacterized membrane protein
MAKPAKLPYRRWPKPIRIILVRPRLFSSALVGLLIIGVLTFSTWPESPLSPDKGKAWALQCLTNVLIGWVVGVGLYLALAFRLFMRSDIAQIRRQAASQDEGRYGIPLGTAAASLASLGVIFYWLNSATRAEMHQPLDLALLISTILLSWGFIHTIFALHYAHEFYAEHRTKGGGLNFPGKDKPNYWDFVYFSFGIGMTAQVSDVTVSSRIIRNTVTIHSFVSFIFNVAVLALAVNLAASAILTPLAR